MINLTLSSLAGETEYSKDQIRFFLAMLKETECLDFVQALCQAAYNQGYEDNSFEDSCY